MSQYQRLDDVPSDCPCDWQMGGRKDRKTGRPAKAGTAARGRGSDAESETSVMSGTSSEKRLLAQTRDQLREAGEEALRMASAHETPRECCLLVLNLVSSTLSCIRQPRPRLRVLDVCGFV